MVDDTISSMESKQQSLEKQMFAQAFRNAGHLRHGTELAMAADEDVRVDAFGVTEDGHPMMVEIQFAHQTASTP